MSPSPAVADLITALEQPGGIHPGLARRVSALLTGLDATPRPARPARRIRPFPVRRLTRARSARLTRTRSARPARARTARPTRPARRRAAREPRVPAHRRLG